MTHPIEHADLVARALGALSGAELARVDEALAADADLRQAFEQVAAHLLVYDRLPSAPPAPPFARIDAALEAEAAIAAGESAEPDLRVLRLQSPARPAPRATWQRVVGLAAATLLVGLLVWRPWTAPPHGDLTIVPGEGLRLVRAGKALPAPAHAVRAVRKGDLVQGRGPVELRLAGRIRIVLDTGARLRIEGGEAVTLEAGRAWFEVKPGTFEVRTAYGPVRVLGTAFEVDVRTDDLVVGVAHGLVEVELIGVAQVDTPHVAAPQAERATTTVATGQRLLGGRVQPAPFPAGEWFGRPRLRVTEALVVAGSPVAAGAPATVGSLLRLTLILDNPHHVPVPLRGPSGTRFPLWLHLADAEGRPVRELPILAANIRAGADLLTPGLSRSLAPGGKKILTVEIPAPFASAGTYLCRALYRPAGRPGLLSDALRIEVR